MSPFPPGLTRKFRPGRLLASGGHGQVYLAHQVELDRPVALKILSREVLANPEERARFQLEARATARLTHPGIVRIVDHDVDDGIPWIAYEYLPGKTLRQRIDEGPLEVDEAIEVAAQVAGALAAAHAQGILHRDIKPDNVIADGQGTYKVADFGIAKWAQGEEVRTQAGLIVGTPGYLAPERIHGQPATGKADVYSIGVMLFELLTRRLPLPGDDLGDLLRRPISEDSPSIRLFRPDASIALERVVRAALERDPADRTAGAAELEAALRQLGDLDHTTPDAPRVTGNAARIHPRAGSAIAGAFMLVVASFVMFRTPAPRDSAPSPSMSPGPSSRPPVPPEVVELLTLSREAAGRGDFEAAAAILQPALREHPSEPDLVFELAAMLDASGKLPEAEKRYREAIELSPEQSGFLTHLGMHLVGRERFDEAAPFLERACRLDEAAPWPRILIAQIHLKAGEIEKALLRAREAIEGRPEARPMAHAILAIVLDRQGDVPGSRGEFARSLAAYASSNQPPSWTADFLVRAGKIDEADPHYMLAERNPATERGLYLTLAHWRLRRHEPKIASRWFQEHLRLDPDHIDARTRLAYLLEQNEQHLEAIEQYQELTRRTSSESAWLGIARCKMLREDFTGASQALAMALKIAPEHYQARALRVRIWHELGREAEKEADIAALEAQPVSDEMCEDYHSTVAGMWTAISRPDRTDETLRKGLARMPRSCRLLKDIAVFLQNTRRLDEAREQLLAAEARCPDTEGILRARIDVAHEMKRDEEELDLVQRCLELKPRDEGLRLRLARLLYSLGQEAEAIDLWSEILAANPGCDEAMRKLFESAALRTKFIAPVTSPSRDH